MDYTKLANSIEILYLSKLSSERAEHSRRTADYARFMAEKYSVNREKAYIAGLAHDVAKEKNSRDILTLAELYKPEEIFDDERKLPLLLHGRAGAGLLKKELTIVDEDILDSITWHISGTYPMSALAKIIYCSDFLELGRDFIAEGFREQALSGDLDHAVRTVLLSLLRHRLKKGHGSCQREKLVMDWLKIGRDEYYA